MTLRLTRSGKSFRWMGVITRPDLKELTGRSYLTLNLGDPLGGETTLEECALKAAMLDVAFARLYFCEPVGHLPGSTAAMEAAKWKAEALLKFDPEQELAKAYLSGMHENPEVLERQAVLLTSSHAQAAAAPPLPIIQKPGYRHCERGRGDPYGDALAVKMPTKH